MCPEQILRWCCVIAAMLLITSTVMQLYRGNAMLAAYLHAWLLLLLLCAAAVLGEAISAATAYVHSQAFTAFATLNCVCVCCCCCCSPAAVLGEAISAAAVHVHLQPFITLATLHRICNCDVAIHVCMQPFIASAAAVCLSQCLVRRSVLPAVWAL
jgi:uncharacterized membrane protein